jgi:hypothetical protein
MSMKGIGTLGRIEPSTKLDVRVMRVMREELEASRRSRSAAPFLPIERSLYAIVAVAYALYVAANAAHLLNGVVHAAVHQVAM